MQDHASFVMQSAAPLMSRLRGLTPEQVPAAFQGFSEDEQMLFLFASLVSHGQDGLSGCGQELPHRLASPSFWEALRGAFQRLEDEDMLDLIDRWHVAVQPALPADGSDVSNDAEAMFRVRDRLARLDPATMAVLDGDFRLLLPAAQERMARYLRARKTSIRA
ncbi:MAG TPA: hypothetical protein VFA20_14620 [Myxococcaceae bacterium]|nr:hypothetical protein [Myxococcaceae bacterium]